MIKYLMRRACFKNKDEILKKANVCGIKTGKKEIKGTEMSEDAIVVMVDKKVKATELAAKDVIPTHIGGYITDVQETGEIELLHRKKHRPVIGGTSGICEGGSACSIALKVYNREGQPCAWTNEHCAHIGGKNMLFKKFLQPSPFDGGKADDAIGTIVTVPKIDPNKVNDMDSILIPLDEDAEERIQGIGEYKKAWVKPKVGMKLIKPGRTTGVTRAIIDSVDAYLNVRQGDRIVQFGPCITAKQNNWDVVAGGDSGSVILNEEGIIGQTFAGGPNIAVFLIGTIVRDKLGIRLENPQEGYIALGNWLSINRLEITTKHFPNRATLRSSIGLGDNIIRRLPGGTKLEVLKFEGIADNYYWVKVRI